MAQEARLFAMALVTVLARGASGAAIYPTALEFYYLGTSMFWLVDSRARAAMDVATRRPSCELLLMCLFSLLSSMAFFSPSFAA